LKKKRKWKKIHFLENGIEDDFINSENRQQASLRMLIQFIGWNIILIFSL